MAIPQVRYRIFGRDGTVDHVQMRDLIRRGEVTSLSDIAPEGSEHWQPAGNRAELQRYFALAAAKSQSGTRPSAVAHSTFAFGIVILVAGFVFAMSSTGDFLNGTASSRWPAAEARMIYRHHLDETRWWHHVRYYILKSRYDHGGTPRKWRLHVGYEFHVNGQKYRSHAISFGRVLSSALQRRLHAKPLLAYYDPAMPRRAVLHPGVTFGSAATLIGGGLIMLLGGLIAFVPGFLRRFVNAILW